MSSLYEFVDPRELLKTENVELLTKRIVDGYLSGRHRSKLKGGSASFAEHRDYTPGDEVRLIDWRVYGRSDRYLIKQFEEDTRLQATLVIDASGSMGFGMGTATKFEHARAACLALARLVLRQSDAAGLAVVGGGVRSYIPPRARASHLNTLIETLRSTTPSGKTTLANDLSELTQRMGRRGLVLLFSDCFDNVENLAHSLKMLRSRRHEALLFHVMAPEELSFSFRDWSRFESLEAEGVGIELDPVSVRAEYLERLQAFLTRLRGVCGEAGCDYVPLVTDKPLGDVLANYLRRRAATA
jgi:uncharacterized protein (DUF58 family)